MVEINREKREMVLKNHRTFDAGTICFWYNTINKRLDYLRPLLNELELKDMKLRVVCNSLADEVYEIKLLKELLEEYQK